MNVRFSILKSTHVTHHNHWKKSLEHIIIIWHLWQNLALIYDPKNKLGETGIKGLSQLDEDNLSKIDNTKFNSERLRPGLLTLCSYQQSSRIPTYCNTRKRNGCTYWKRIHKSTPTCGGLECLQFKIESSTASNSPRLQDIEWISKQNIILEQTHQQIQLKIYLLIC